ncbi:hypothetical protein CY652_10390 [Burkholderia sp. WAC0059]|uniref:hypothetical protein n=1 Tax=Burkholderia sp. WAC0059 TaxID=2066022 RepID=UPI000C7EFF00|nr:hypothetical protein [Burkholderia sp. WAC0059]PLZ02517.1 hypothetical protein CY652_10390 [Burkholderia sp. WAC0059]
MAGTKDTRAAAVAGAGTLFALRAIGLVILARWLFSMSQMDILAALTGMASSPWACINLVFLFLIVFLPGARARAERPFHPLPQWLRQALRLFALLGFLFAAWSIGAFVWTAGWKRVLHAIAETNGWLVAAPVLYVAVVWICRPRALWRTNVAARRFAIGRYAISLDSATRTTVVWAESRKVGQYDARELSVRWPEAAYASPGGTVARAEPTGGRADDGSDGRCDDGAGSAGAGAGGETRSAPVSGAASRKAGKRLVWPRRPKVELLWNSPAAAGHNRQTVFRAPLVSDGDRTAARALDAALRQA